MHISKDLIRQTIVYLEANAKDSVGQTLLKQLQLVLEVNEEAQVESEGGNYHVGGDRPLKAGDLARYRQNNAVSHLTIL